MSCDCGTLGLEREVVESAGDSRCGLRHHESTALAHCLRGWGTFDMVVLLKWKTGSVHRTTWELQFDQPDASRELDVPPPAPPTPPPPPSVPAAPAAPVAATPAAGVLGEEVLPVAPWEEENSDVFEVRGSIAGVDSADEAVVEVVQEETRDSTYL